MNNSLYDLEQNILSCWTITDELDVVASAVEEGNQDEILNMLIGLKALYSRKFEILFEKYEATLREMRTVSKEEIKQPSTEPFGY